MTSGSKCTAVSNQHRDKVVPCKVTGLGGHFHQELWDVSFIVPRRYGARALQRRMQFSFLNNPTGLADRALKPTTKG